MFQNILICSFVLKNSQYVIGITFELAKKFNSNIIFLKCLHEGHPTFGLFQTKSEKKKQNELAKEAQLALQEFEEMAKYYNISVKTENVFVDSLSEFVAIYVQKNNIELLVVNSTPPSDIDIHNYKDIVNHIYKNIECPILTLK
ncbi:MAG: hypothetical protein OES34_03995 [Nitrosopumilus sp.]|nr:hypothetical protein [Nitrosopumilus sp.]